MEDWYGNRYECEERGVGEADQWIDVRRERKEDEAKGHGVRAVSKILVA